MCRRQTDGAGILGVVGGGGGGGGKRESSVCDIITIAAA